MYKMKRSGPGREPWLGTKLEDNFSEKQRNVLRIFLVCLKNKYWSYDGN